MNRNQRHAQRHQEERREWEEFEEKLNAASSFEDAHRIVIGAVSPNAPGRQFYSNLGFFLGSFIVPHGSSLRERKLYLAFMERIKDAPYLKPDAAVETIERLQKSLNDEPKALDFA